MKRIFLSASLSILALVSMASVPAWAQVEPRFVGDWQLEPTPDQPARTLHIDSSGRYQSMSNGRVIESGTLTASDGNWKLKSDSGQTDSGRFTVISGELRLHSGSLQGWWMRPQGGSAGTAAGAAAGASAAATGVRSSSGRALGQPTSSHPSPSSNTRPVNYPPASNESTPYFSTPAYAPSDPAYNSVQPQSQRPGYSSHQNPSYDPHQNPSYDPRQNPSYGAAQNPSAQAPSYAPHPEGQPYTPQSPAFTRQKPGYNIPGYSPDMLPGYSGQHDSGPPRSGYWNTPEHIMRPSSRSPSGSSNWTGDRDENGHPIVKAVPGDNTIEIRTVRPGAYISPMWRQGPPELRGPNWKYEPSQPAQRPPSTWTPEQNHVTPGSNSSASASPGEYQYPPEQRKTDFDTWSKWQQQFRGMQGPRPVPKGGYIPVMKDGAARRFFGH